MGRHILLRIGGCHLLGGHVEVVHADEKGVVHDAEGFEDPVSKLLPDVTKELPGVTSSMLPAVPLDGVHEVVVELVLQEDALGVHLHEVKVLKNQSMCWEYRILSDFGTLPFLNVATPSSAI